MGKIRAFKSNLICIHWCSHGQSVPAEWFLRPECVNDIDDVCTLLMHLFLDDIKHLGHLLESLLSFCVAVT